jgi:serine/threonine protein phosphatase PrpC
MYEKFVALGRHQKTIEPQRYRETLRGALAMLPRRNLEFLRSLVSLISSFVDGEGSPTGNDLRSVASALGPLILRPFDDISGDHRNHEYRCAVVGSLLEEPDLATDLEESSASVGAAIDLLRSTPGGETDVPVQLEVGFSQTDAAFEPFSLQGTGADGSNSLFGVCDGRGSKAASAMVAAIAQSCFVELTNGVVSNDQGEGIGGSDTSSGALLSRLFFECDARYRREPGSRGHGVSLAVVWVKRKRGITWLRFANAGDVTMSVHFVTPASASIVNDKISSASVSVARVSRCHTAGSMEEQSRIAQLASSSNNMSLMQHFAHDGDISRGIGYSDPMVRTPSPSQRVAQVCTDYERIVIACSGMSQLSETQTARLLDHYRREEGLDPHTAVGRFHELNAPGGTDAAGRTAALMVVELR